MASTPSKMVKRVLKAANGLHVALYRICGGKFGGEIAHRVAFCMFAGRLFAAYQTDKVGGKTL